MTRSLDILATASRFAIAAAIVYFGYQLAQINNRVPEVMQSVDDVSQHIEPTLAEVALVRGEITELRKLIPDILAEVGEVRRQIPPIVVEVGEVRRSIPPVLAEVAQVREQIPSILTRVDAIERQIPEIVATANRTVTTIDKTRAEVVPLVPQALEEIRLTREKIDPTLDRVDDLVDDTYFKAQDAIASAQAAGQQASEGAVKGFFTGIVKLPFQLVGTLASPITKNISPDVAKQITEKDIELLVAAGSRAVESGRTDRERRWENPDSGNSGSITILRFFELQGLECIEARIRISNRRREILNKLNEFCRGEDDRWTLASEIE